MIRPIFVSPISPVLHYGNRPKLVSLESYDHGESNAVGCKDFESELAEDVGIYRETIKGAQIRNIGAFLLNEFLWLYLAGQRLETEVKGQGLCMLVALMGHFLIFWLESLYVKKSKLLSIEKLPLLLLL